jgi:hypothetical protein
MYELARSHATLYAAELGGGRRSSQLSSEAGVML